MTDVVRECGEHGLVPHRLRADSGTYRCRKCASDAVVKRRQRIKQTLVDEAGGQCGLCGYSRCVAALQFHHLDPAQKTWAVSNYSRSLDFLREEAAKCVLLCGNCHVEVEHGISFLGGETGSRA